MKIYGSFFKRVVDFTAAGGVLLLLSPVIGATALWLHFANKGSGAFFFRSAREKGVKYSRWLSLRQ